MTPKHLTNEAAQALRGSLSDKIEYAQRERWIGYPRAQKILKTLDDLFVHPKTQRMPNLLIVADTNNGKSTIINQFARRYPRVNAPESDRTSIPVLIIQATASVDEGRLYAEILRAINPPFKTPGRLDQRHHMALKMMDLVGTKILVIDEFQNALASRITQRTQFLNAIKNLGNDLRIPIVAAGTSLAFNALQSDAQLSNRFEPAILPKWKADAEFGRLLASFERFLPLPEESKLSVGSLAIKIHSMTEGTIGEVSKLLTRAATLAIEKEKPKIDDRVLMAVDYVSPSRRQRQSASA
jgi:hypothetical protein